MIKRTFQQQQQKKQFAQLPHDTKYNWYNCTRLGKTIIIPFIILFVKSEFFCFVCLTGLVSFLTTLNEMNHNGKQECCLRDMSS